MGIETFRNDVAIPVGSVSAATLAWRYRGALRVTVIAKATFAFAEDAPMSATAPQEMFRAEVHHGNNPARSIRFTADLAPYLERADVLFTGDAHALGGAADTLLVRLGVFDGTRPLLDKSLQVKPRGAARVPIVYERAYGGPG